jgi:DNA modification methylase
MKLTEVHNLDFLKNELPDKCADLVIADPPYFEVKGEFDFIWPDFESYLNDVERWAIECKRILKDNGTLFWWGDAKKLAYSQIILDKHFNLLNNIVWQKTECQTLRNEISALRSFAPVTERVLMYDKGEDQSGNERIFDDPELFMPLKIYFDDWLEKSGMTYKEAVSRIGTTASHWFGFSKRPKTQFCFPTREKWLAMEELFPNRKQYDELRLEYEEIRGSYESLRLQYEELRRYFHLDYMQTDVMKFSQEAHITGKYQHETKKPETLTRNLILATTKKDDLIVIPFGGSGTECAMASKEERNFIAFEIQKDYCEMIEKRVEQHKNQPKLF